LPAALPPPLPAYLPPLLSALSSCPPTSALAAVLPHSPPAEVVSALRADALARLSSFSRGPVPADRLCAVLCLPAADLPGFLSPVPGWTAAGGSFSYEPPLTPTAAGDAGGLLEAAGKVERVVMKLPVGAGGKK
ncbi:hypothetical protein TeGR_g10398, partial [Tetraparma gracilis]